MSEYEKGEVKKIMLVVIVLIILLAGIIYLRIQKKTALDNAVKPSPVVFEEQKEIIEPTLTFFPMPGTYSVVLDRQIAKTGETVTAKVNFFADGKVLDGSDVLLQFDPSLLQASENIIFGNYFQNYPVQKVDNEKGIIRVSGLMSISKESMKSPALLFAAEFSALKKGTATVGFDFEKGRTDRTTLVENGTSRNILGTAQSAVLKIE